MVESSSLKKCCSMSTLAIEYRGSCMYLHVGKKKKKKKKKEKKKREKREVWESNSHVCWKVKKEKRRWGPSVHDILLQKELHHLMILIPNHCGVDFWVPNKPHQQRLEFSAQFDNSMPIHFYFFRVQNIKSTFPLVETSNQLGKNLKYHTRVIPKF